MLLFRCDEAEATIIGRSHNFEIEGIWTMSLKELTSREAVKSAIEECDRLGRDNFLQTYGFQPARKYVLIFNGRKYDSKAIAGVAYRHQFPNRGHLTAHMFSGGITRNGAATRLRELGFEIESLAGI
jgi:hypothetical protein